MSCTRSERLSYSPGAAGEPAELCIFLRLSSSGLLPGAGRGAGETAVPVAGRVKGREG